MTELKIQPKKRSGMGWLWLIPLVLLLLWLFTRHRGDDTSTTTTTRTDSLMTTPATMPAGPGAGSTIGATGTTGGTTGSASASGDYATFIGTAAPDRDESAQHQYTADGIRRLAAAIEGSSAGASAGGQVATMRAMADSLNMSPAGSDRHADMARRAFDAAATALKAMPGANGSSLDAAASAVKPGKHLLAQKAEIQRFFEASRDALGASAGATTATPTTTATP